MRLGVIPLSDFSCLCQWELKAPTDRSQSDCVHEQVAKADCECPLYKLFSRGAWQGVMAGFNFSCAASVIPGRFVAVRRDLILVVNVG